MTHQQKTKQLYFLARYGLSIGFIAGCLFTIAVFAIGDWLLYR